MALAEPLPSQRPESDRAAQHPTELRKAEAEVEHQALRVQNRPQSGERCLWFAGPQSDRTVRRHARCWPQRPTRPLTPPILASLSFLMLHTVDEKEEEAEQREEEARGCS